MVGRPLPDTGRCASCRFYTCIRESGREPFLKHPAHNSDSHVNWPIHPPGQKLPSLKHTQVTNGPETPVYKEQLGELKERVGRGGQGHDAAHVYLEGRPAQGSHLLSTHYGQALCSTILLTRLPGLFCYSSIWANGDSKKYNDWPRRCLGCKLIVGPQLHFRTNAAPMNTMSPLLLLAHCPLMTPFEQWGRGSRSSNSGRGGSWRDDHLGWEHRISMWQALLKHWCKYKRSTKLCVCVRACVNTHTDLHIFRVASRNS